MTRAIPGPGTGREPVQEHGPPTSLRVRTSPADLAARPGSRNREVAPRAWLEVNRPRAARRRPSPPSAAAPPTPADEGDLAARPSTP
jgi:hypothetical protein